MLKTKSNYGSQIKLGDKQEPEQFVTIPGTYLIPPIEKEQEDIEVTHHGSGKYREYIASGLSETGEVSFEMYSIFPDTVQDEIRGLEENGEVRNWQFIYPNGMGKQFSAYVKNIVMNEADATSPDAIKETVTLKLTGDITKVNTPGG